MKKTRRLTALFLALVMVLTLCLTPLGGEFTALDTEAAAVTPVSAHGALAVKGTNLVDKNGKNFQIRGISTHGLGWYPQYNNQAAYQTLRDDWKANCVRLAMYTQEYNGYTTGNKQGMLAEVEKGISYATNLGMYVIVDWHILSDGNPQTHKAEAKEFFNYIASKYKDYNNILYEICNEPNGCSWSDIKSYAQEVIPVIRQYDSDAVIIVGTPTWSQLGSAGHLYEPCEDPIRGYDNLMYTFHFYASDPGHNQWLKNKIPTAIDQYKIPVFVTEFGLSEASGNGNVDAGKASEWLSMCDKYNVSYCAWSLCNKAETSALINSSCGKTSGWSEGELSTAGNVIRNWYRSRPAQESADTSKEDNPTVKNKATGITVSYRSHVQGIGWQAWKKNGKMSGTRGEGRRLEALQMKVSGDKKLGIRYKAYVEGSGWQTFRKNGVTAGTTGTGKRIEAIKVELTGANKDKYDVYYRVQVESYGWLGWARNGEKCGTEGYGKRVEAINVAIVKKGAKTGLSRSGHFVTQWTGKVNYRTHVQQVGWQNFVSDGAMSGTSGRALRLEGIEIKLNSDISGGIQYRTHVQRIGWQGWVSNGAMSGTSGQSLRLEAICIKLTGKAAQTYDVYYRVHVQQFGWLGWAKNGQQSGSAGYSYRLEGIEIRLVKKGGPAPGSTANRMMTR